MTLNSTSAVYTGSAVYSGSGAVSKVYKGTNLIWESAPPTVDPPTLNRTVPCSPNILGGLYTSARSANVWYDTGTLPDMVGTLGVEVELWAEDKNTLLQEQVLGAVTPTLYRERVATGNRWEIDYLLMLSTENMYNLPFTFKVQAEGGSLAYEFEYTTAMLNDYNEHTWGAQPDTSALYDDTTGVQESTGPWPDGIDVPLGKHIIANYSPLAISSATDFPNELGTWTLDLAKLQSLAPIVFTCSNTPADMPPPLYFPYQATLPTTHTLASGSMTHDEAKAEVIAGNGLTIQYQTRVAENFFLLMGLCDDTPPSITYN